MRSTLSLLAAAALLSACSPAQNGVAGNVVKEDPVHTLGVCCPEVSDSIVARLAELERTPPAERSPELALLVYRYNNGVADRLRTTVKSEDAWAALWSRIIARSSPAQPLPRVDFEREMLIVAGMGTRPTGGYAIHIDSVRSRSGQLEVWVRELSPGRTCGTTQALTSPVALARVTLSTEPIVFRESAASRSC